MRYYSTVHRNEKSLRKYAIDEIEKKEIEK